MLRDSLRGFLGEIEELVTAVSLIYMFLGGREGWMDGKELASVRMLQSYFLDPFTSFERGVA